MEGIRTEEDWLRGRMTGVGSSDSPVIVLGSVYKTTPQDIYISKKSSPKVETGNPHFRRGHTYEPLAAALAVVETGVAIHTPVDAGDRYSAYFQRLGHRPILANFDGICSDGWVFEAKAPTENRFEQIVEDGVDEYYQVQCHHLAGVANEASRLPGVGAAYRGKIKGTRLVFYAPESVRLHIVEIPFSQETVDMIFDRCETWWNEHVVLSIPPIVTEPAQPTNMVKIAGEYIKLQAAEAWEQVVTDYIAARALREQAEERENALKQSIMESMLAAGLDKISLPSGVKVSYAEQSGRFSFDQKLLQATYPDMNFERFVKRGGDYRVLRVSQKKV